MQVWCGGSGYSDYEAVSNDLIQMQNDTSDDPAALVADGGQLEADAQAAGTSLPPFGKQHTLNYGLAMGYLLLVGGKTSEGDISGAEAALQKADGFLPGVAGLVASDCPGG